MSLGALFTFYCKSRSLIQITYFILQLIDARFTSQSRNSIAPHQKSGRAQPAAKGGPKQLDVLIREIPYL